MPQSAAATQDQYTALDPRRDPIGFVFENKDALANMPEDKAIKFVDMLFRRYVLPKYIRVNQQKPLDEEEIENLRIQFAGRMFGLPPEQINLKEEAPKHGLLAKTGAVASAAGAGVIGGLRSIEELREKIQKYTGIEKITKYDPVNMLLKKAMTPAGRVEGKAYEEARATAPTGASVAAGVGHQIPASIVAGGVGSIFPQAGRAAPLAQKLLMGGSRGAIEGAAFEGSRPGGDIQQGADWGGALGAAFPILGKFFGLGRKVLTSAPKAVEAAESSGGSAARAASSESKSLGSLADKAAKDKFGKAFKDLSSAEKAQMPQIMKEEIAKQRAQAAATKKAEVAAAKAGREAEATAKRAVKADAAKAKAAQQAVKRAAVPVQTPAAKQAVAAQAATENPAVAKMMGGINAAGMEESLKTRTPAGLAQALRAETDDLKMRLRTGAHMGQPEVIEGRIAENEKLIKEYDEKAKIPEVKKVPEGEAGKKVRAKGGQPASPAQQAADRERIAAKRAEAKSQEFGAALEKHAQQMAGKYTSATQVGAQHIPELEEAAKEIEGGEIVLRGLQKLRRAKKITDEIYADSLKEWLLKQFEGVK